MSPATAKRPRVRLDQLLVERGLVETRTRAQALLLAGKVRVGKGDSARLDRKPGDLLDPATPVVLVEQDPYVSRGGHKLVAALDAFEIDPAGRVALDVGASTGGFTDVLLQRGATRVYALDVGRGQLAETLRHDARVVSMERTNARTLTATTLPEPVSLVTFDVSFISLRLVLGPAAQASLQATPVATPDGTPIAEADTPVVLFAADGMRPDLVETYAADGSLPTIAGLLADGVSGDNGMLQGEHRLPPLLKNLPYEPSVRAPCLLRAPGLRPSVISQPVHMTVDLTATCVDVAGAQPDLDLDGTSLFDIVDDPGRYDDRRLLYDRDDRDDLESSPFPPAVGVFTQTRKLIRWTTEPPTFELYDLDHAGGVLRVVVLAEQRFLHG